MAASMRVRNKHLHSKENRYASERSEPSPHNPVQGYQPWTPSAYTAFKAVLSARLCAAIWSNISDCDEVFNYWEPLHYLMHGSGFQTWEYSPAYAIRSYAYVGLNMIPIKLYAAILEASKILQFYFLRCVLAFVCSLCEVYFYRGICKCLGANTGRISLCFLLFSSGYFISCTAFLPSTFSMYCTMTAMAGWMLGHHPVAIFSVAASAIVAWPFAGAIGIPIAWDLLVCKRQIWMFIKWSALSAVVCLAPMIQVDSHYYGGLVVAPLNIVLYNVFSDHGPELYGVESWTFYFMNGFLNFNVAFFMALVALPLTVVVSYILRQPSRGMPMWLVLAPMYIWIIVFFTRPHKEERFLFPIYPFFPMGAAICMDYIQKLWSYVFSKPHSRHYTDTTNWLTLTCVLGFSLLSVSRSIALFQGYHAPLDIYGELGKIAEDPKIHTLPPDKDVNVCVGKEWYRFPSSYFLPNDRWRLQFIKSQFAGQLPKPFGKGPGATRKIPTDMNDMNLEETSRYIDVSKCHYLIDLDLPDEVEYEPRYASYTKEWKVVASVKFLDANRSHKILRAFYIPFLSERFCTYVDYNVLKTTRTKSKVKV